MGNRHQDKHARRWQRKQQSNYKTSKSERIKANGLKSIKTSRTADIDRRLNAPIHIPSFQVLEQSWDTGTGDSFNIAQVYSGGIVIRQFKLIPKIGIDNLSMEKTKTAIRKLKLSISKLRPHRPLAILRNHERIIDEAMI